MIHSDKMKALCYYALRGRYFEVQTLLIEGVDPNGKDRIGRTALMLAAGRSHTDVVELLINSFADIHCCDDKGWTSLHHASRGGSVELVQCLVNKGCALDKKNCDGEAPLIVAARCSHREVVKLLINSGADIHCCDEDGWTLLHYYASFQRSVEMVQCLVNKGIDIDGKGSGGVTLVMLAAEKSYTEVVELLIDSGADIHCCDENGFTLMHHALQSGLVEIVQCLVNKGVALDEKSSKGRTPLHMVVRFNNREIADYLLKAGADCNLEDNEGESPFSCLIKKRKLNVETIELCIEKGAYVKSTDYHKLLKEPLLKKVILQDIKLCSQAVINKFNNKDLNLLYKGLASAHKLPHIDKMKIRNGGGMALEVEKAVTREIQAKGFCDIFKMVPLVLGILCVKCLVEKPIPAFNLVNLSESQNGSE